MIGVFDSGIGGLTVLKELFRVLPECSLVYLGDTARTPYGSKSPTMIQRFALEDARFLTDRGARIIVVACNTVSALAVDALKTTFPDIPIIEVVTPAVAEACTATRNGIIGVIGTRATVASGIYNQKIETALAGIYDREKWREFVVSAPCPLLVPLAEEGWLDRPETRSIIREYLLPLLKKNIDTLILGCTHYPLLEKQIRAVTGGQVAIINPARAVAGVVKKTLDGNQDLQQICSGGSRLFYVTDLTPHLTQTTSDWFGFPIKLELARVA